MKKFLSISCFIKRCFNSPSQISLTADLSLKMNLKIHNLENVEFGALQKCLLPKSIGVELPLPGTWIQCVSDNGHGYLCQVYLRDCQSNACFLDQSVFVCSEENSFSNSQQTLQTINIMSHRKNALPAIKLIFLLDAKFFTKTNCSHELLIQMSLPTLLTHTLCNNCRVQNAELQAVGIKRIQIQAEVDSNVCFDISDNTKLHIEDVQIKHAGAHMHIHTSLKQIYSESYEKLQQLLLLKRARNALITGVSGVGKSSLAQVFLQQQNCNYFNITAGAVMGQYPGETQQKLRQIFEAATKFLKNFQPKNATVIFIEDLYMLCPATTDANGARICAQMLRLLDDLKMEFPQIICLATSSSGALLSAQARRPGRFDCELNLEAPTVAQRKKLFASMWQEQLGERLPLTDTLLQQIEQHTHGYLAADLELLVLKMKDAYWRSVKEQQFCTATILKNTLQKLQPNALSGAEISVYKMTDGLSSIGGMQHLKRYLQTHVVERLSKPANYARFGLKMPKGILLYGPPGCAKTTVAKCLAAEANMMFIATSGAEVYSPYVGCAERFIAKLFDTARKNAPCILFLDEIDTLVGRRATISSGSDDVQMRILATLLTEMDGVVSGDNTKTQILVVAATNRPFMVDDALLRPGRFDKLIHVPAPDTASRLDILELHAKRMPFNIDVNLKQLAEQTQHFSGADIGNLCNEAALAALERNIDSSEICMKDFGHVLKEYKSSLDQHIIDSYINYEQGQCRHK